MINMRNIFTLLLGILLLAVPASGQTTNKKKVGYVSGVIVGVSLIQFLRLVARVILRVNLP